MGCGATEHEILEKKLEKRLRDPKTEPLICLPLEFLEDITGGFSTEQVLGEGGYGVIYKGVLRTGKTIAVKKIFDKHLLDNYNRVENEIICLKEVNHQNVVQLVGYCVQTNSELMEHSGKHVMAEKRACLLCFEFLCNGSLDKHLCDDTSSLDWDKRYKIIRGVCRGLHYLHDKHRIVHRDLKPQNILMDDMMMPKIGGFDLSRILGQEKSRTVTANFAGTPGYMAPECIEQRSISFEADIFSLGVIIIEIITGHRDYPNISETIETSFKHYTDEVVGSWRNRLIEITPTHMSLEMCIQQVQHCIDIALKCLAESNKRPTSLDIVQSLNAVEPKCTSPGNPPSAVEKDRGNQNLQTQVNVNTTNIATTISAINGLNECANLFQWVTSAISSPKLQLNEIQMEKFHGNIRQLHSDLQCLSDTLPAMYNLIDRAEWRIHDHCVADLLSRLKHAVYDAEDILDEFRWYETKLSVEGNAISMKSIIDFFQSVTQDSFNKVTDIQKRLNLLSEQLVQMGLLKADVPRFHRSFRPETTSFPTEAKVFGRYKEKNKLIRLLGVPTNNCANPSRYKRKRSGVCSSASNEICATIDGNETTIRSVPVLPMLGIGGVGKTTLAQEICNKSEVKNHFDLIIWICVSDDFDVKRLTKEALDQSLPPKKVPKTDNLNLLQGALARSLNSKRFLMVLDDMWDENEMDWKRFCGPFRNVLKGSMMLVTTRSPKVADVVRTMDPFPLKGLNKDVFREFFKLCVFGPYTSNIDPELKRIGEKILPKLKGSPLAAKTLGRLLGINLHPAHWDSILNSQLWELQQKETDILPALRLSYMYLPFYLKRCFSFCAVYPTDYNFVKEDLVEIWVAEGFVEHHPNVSLQHTGRKYFEELAHLSFFQKHPWHYGKYVMHDLIHEMAQLVSKDECCVIKDTKDFPRIPQNVRHLLVLEGGDVECSDLLKHDMARHRKLRTLLCNLSLRSKTGDTVIKKWCTELLCMRVMVCFSVSTEWGLPDSISNMKLLRYLRILNYSGFGMLINLQKFESVKCQYHHIHSVGTHKGGTDQGQGSQFELKHYDGESLPSWFHPQNSEQIHSTNSTFFSLTDVKIINCRNLSNLEQFLQPVYVPLIKKVEIWHCTSLESVPTGRFRDLCFLEVLSVSNCPKIKSGHLFAPSLKKLYLENSGNLGYKIECCSLTILHLSKCSLEFIELKMCPLLHELKISSCPSLTVIRDLEPVSSDILHGEAGNLQLLQELEISSCPSLTVIRDSEPVSSDILHGEARSRAINHTFLSPNDVEITDCSNLSSQEQIVPTDRFGYFRFLEVLNVSHCPKIKSRHLFAPSVKKLYLDDSGDLGHKIECSSLTILNLSNYPLESIKLQLWNLPLLQELRISDCPSLTVIIDSEPISSDNLHGEARSRAIGNTFRSLTVVQIRNCHNLTSLEQFLQPLYVPIIRKIEIYYCRNLQSVPTYSFGDLCFLEVLHVSHCPMIKSQRLFAPSLKELCLWNSGNLGGNIECSSLTILQLSEYPLESIELQMWSLPLLQELWISDCPSLSVIIDSEAISSDILHGEARSRAIGNTFQSLTFVQIRNCPNLTSLEQFLQPLYVPIIQKIEIYYCRSLQSIPTYRFGDLCCLEVLHVSQCPMIISQRLFAPSLKVLCLRNSGNLGSNIECSSLTILQLSEYPLESIELQMWNLPLLQELRISSCPSLTIISDSDPISTDLFHGGARSRRGKLPLLTDLTISSCMKLKTIDDLLYVPAAERIWIVDCSLLSLSPHRLGSLPLLKHLEISNCESLWQSGMLFPSSLQKIRLSHRGDFSAWFPSCLENLTSLKSLEIHDSEFIVSIPDNLLRINLKSLQRLELVRCPNLKTIGAPGAIQHIKYFLIDDCPELKEIDQPMMTGLRFY